MLVWAAGGGQVQPFQARLLMCPAYHGMLSSFEVASGHCWSSLGVWIGKWGMRGKGTTPTLSKGLPKAGQHGNFSS
jgi:hypothetical protein